MKPLKLSVVMPNYNHGRYIAVALEAIVSQSFKPSEVIVCDDGSTDDSVEIIRGFADRYNFVRLIKNDTNLGAFAAHNKLMSLACGDYLYSAAADDRILPGFFEKSMRLLTRYPQAGICSAMSMVIDEEGRKNGLVLNPVVSARPAFFSPDKVRAIFSKQGSWIYGVTTILRLDYVRANGGYRPELYSFSDGFIEELLALKYGACFIPEPLTCWRRLNSGYSMTVGSNPELYGELIKKATFLMQAEPSQVFPSEYIEKWRRQNSFYLQRGIYRQAALKKRERISASVMGKGFLAKLKAGWFKGLLFLQEAFVSVYLFFIFKRNPWRTCNNRIRHFFIKRRYIQHPVLADSTGGTE